MRWMVLAAVLVGCGGTERADDAASTASASACDYCPGAATVITDVFLPDGTYITDGGANPISIPDGGVTMMYCTCPGAPPGSNFLFRFDPQPPSCAHTSCEFTFYCANGHLPDPGACN